MRNLISFINKLIYGKVEASSTPSAAEPIFVPIAAPAQRNNNDAATRPTRRVEDHELLKFHKTIDMAG